jgi:hypothetical protein
MKENRSKFFVSIPVKPYVKRYLEINYGSPVSFDDHPDEKIKLLQFLKKPNHRFDQMYCEELKHHTEFVEVLISRDDFMRYGFELSKTDIISFGKRYEGTIKMVAKLYIQFKKGYSNLKDSVIDFQKLYDLDDDHWDYESIKKEIDRNGIKPDINFREQVNKSFNEFFLKNIMQEEKRIKLMTKRGYVHYLERL